MVAKEPSSLTVVPALRRKMLTLSTSGGRVLLRHSDLPRSGSEPSVGGLGHHAVPLLLAVLRAAAR